MLQIRCELLKLRSTRTGLGLFAGMLALVLLALLLHGFGLPAGNLDDRTEQLMVLGRGEFVGALFAALLGALSITSEFRYGTIRPTFLVDPARGRVVVAKVAAGTLLGAGFGLAAGVLAAVVGTAALRARGIDVQLDGDDYMLLVIGSAAAGALWATIGVGAGAIVRAQVPTVVGISAWTLFVEGLLGRNLESAGRFAPGALGMAISGQDPDSLLEPAVGLVLLAVYAAAAAGLGVLVTARRDIT